MTNSKALLALSLLEQPPDKPAKDIFSMSLRLPGDVAERVFLLHDFGPDDHQGKPSKDGNLATPARPFISRNSVVVALIEAGLEAVQAAAAVQQKRKKNHA